MSKHYIAPLSDNIERTSVFYKNRYGFTLAGDLYHLKNLDKNKQYPALIVGAPYGGVKEQGPCIYANELAKRGFIVLTFDPCFMGELKDILAMSHLQIFLQKISVQVLII